MVWTIDPSTASDGHLIFIILSAFVMLIGVGTLIFGVIIQELRRGRIDLLRAVAGESADWLYPKAEVFSISQQQLQQEKEKRAAG